MVEYEITPNSVPGIPFIISISLVWGTADIASSTPGHKEAMMTERLLSGQEGWENNNKVTIMKKIPLFPHEQVAELGTI